MSTEDESKLLDEVTTGMASSRMKGRDPFVGGLPKIESRHPSQVSSGTSPGRDQGHPSACEYFATDLHFDTSGKIFIRTWCQQ